MSAVDAFETDLLELLFNNTAAPNVGNGPGLPPSTAPGNVTVSLHESTILDTATSHAVGETTYASYTRNEVSNRNGTDWVVAGTDPTAVTNQVVLVFGEKSDSGTNDIVHCGIGFLASNVDMKLHAVVSPTLSVAQGVEPQFAQDALEIRLD